MAFACQVIDGAVELHDANTEERGVCL